MAKEASVQRVLNVQSIEGADLIEVVTVLGWQVVTKKGEYKEGDLSSYIQIYTVVPELPEYGYIRYVPCRAHK